ncbi:MAG: DUF4886 domain-containing protein [Psychroserpens sp.]|uniref:DUF4886 domain-containing protein n=1 Tax=Psychroserpens sp. TaxID=2020870 RepID=UPI0030034AB8
MQNGKSLITLIFLAIATLSWSQSTQSDTTRILFIGNSYTYYNSLPELVKAITEEKFPDQVIEIRMVSQGGMTLKGHWQEKEALQAIRSDHWDYVILQEQSKLGMGVMIDDDIYFGQTDLFFEYARKFDVEIKKADAKTVFFMTWSVSSRPEEQEILTHAYSTIAKELNATLAPIGLVWDQLRSSDQFNFYEMDGSHPSPMGSYLAATTIFSSLFEVSPLGLSGSISGNELSSLDEPLLELQPLMDITKEDAQAIQKASWSVVEALQKSGNYPEVQQPKPSYNIPLLVQGEKIDLKNIIGRWYGTSSYGFNYLGLVLDVDYVGDKLEVSLSFYAPDREDNMTVQESKLLENQLDLKMFDSLRTMNSTIQFSLNGDQMTGLLESEGAITMYKHLKLSRENIQNEFDIAAFVLLMQSFQSKILKVGYVKAAVNHYEQYSRLIGDTYLPEESYLNAQGYNFMRDDKMNDALNQFELAMTLYPQSVNTYDSYGEALVKAGKKEKALKIYTKGYELAKKTGDRNLAYIEANLMKLKEGIPILQQMRTPPPPRQ